jgi:hypothetical protein
VDRFEQRLLAEGLRAIEGDSPTLSSSAPVKAANGFEDRLLQRAVALEPQLQISPLFLHFKALIKSLHRLLALFLFVLGASSVQQLFFSEQGTQINFFWAFALFFIPNLFALLLWLLLFLRANRLNSAWLARFSLLLLKTVEKRFNAQATQHRHFWPLFKCYFHVSFSGELGRYQLSAVTHLLWFSYFCGATLMLIMMLATHQVDFIWQTSILSFSSFQWLTELLAYIPNLLGIPVPDPQQIQQSNLAMINTALDAQQSRLVWSTLLISSLLIYGLIPRFLLWFIMHLLLQAKRREFRLNLSDAYYVQLRQQLKPNVTSLGISDPDTVKATSDQQRDTDITSQPLPSSFYPIAIELSEAQFMICSKHVAHYSPVHHGVLKNICDFQAQQSLLKEFADIKESAIVLYVSVARLPDRGLLGFISALTACAGKSFYLLLIDEGASKVLQPHKRSSDWYTLAAQANISLDNIIHLNDPGRYE